MPHLALFSFSPGSTPEQQLALVRGEREPEAEPQEPTTPEVEAAPAPAKAKRRARADREIPQADEPATPEEEREN